MASPRTRTRTRKPKPSVERDLAVRMFEVMALMRAVEDRMVTMYRQGELLGSLYTGHWHEAIAVGTAWQRPHHPPLRSRSVPATMLSRSRVCGWSSASA